MDNENRGMTLCLDIATSTGFAVSDGVKLVESGHVNLATKKGEDVYDAVVKFNGWLESMAAKYRIREILWERVDFVSFASAFATHHRLLTTAVWFAKRHGASYLGVPVGVHRSHCGIVSGDKLGAIRYARERFGIEPTTDDEADAVCIAAALIDGLIDELPALLEESKAKKKIKTDAKRQKTLAKKKAEAMKAAAALAFSTAAN